jgi:pimeloyl-ACP methyl ester carboxylesterase
MPSLASLAPLLAALAVQTAPAAGRAGPASSRLPLARCQLAHPVASARVAARCGTLEVPEDPARPEGRRIALRVAVIPADSPEARPDPVFALAGGPGQAITEVYPQIAPAFERLNRDRDIVLVDQRGTGGSGRLACPALEQPTAELAPSAEGDAAAARACAAALQADLTQYGTASFVRDLEAVRGALGYEKVNAIGFSYGTRAALAWARAHPDRVRTLVLDGVAPFEMVVGADFDVDAERALGLLFHRCQGDPACRTSYPSLERDFRALLARLERKAERVRIRHPLTGEPLDVTVDGDSVRQVVLGFLYQPETAALLPALLRQARDGDLAPLATQGILVSTDIQAGLSRALQLSVLCSEDVPLYPPPTAPAAPTFLGNATRDAFRRLCAAWPHAVPGAAFRRAEALEVPALLLSGEADPVTPPRWAEAAARSLPRALHLALPGQGHGVLARGCMPRIVSAFVKRGGTDGLDTACLERLAPAPIFVDLQGGSP